MGNRLSDPTRRPRPRPRDPKRRAADAELLVLGFLTGVLKACPETQEIAFDGIRVSHRGTFYGELLDVLGRGKLADQVGLKLHCCASTVLGVVGQ